MEELELGRLGWKLSALETREAERHPSLPGGTPYAASGSVSRMSKWPSSFSRMTFRLQAHRRPAVSDANTCEVPASVGLHSPRRCRSPYSPCD